MKLETFLNRINAGKANNCIYQSGENEGLISVWKYNQVFVLTWEECPKGKQYDEINYSRDERLEFGNAEALLEYLRQSSIDVERFTP